MSEHTCGGRGPVPCPACVALAAQERYVCEWREQWPLQTYGEWWQCPLCGKVLQAEPYPPQERQPITVLAQHHQWYHGSDWTSYERLQAPGGADAAAEE